MPTKKANGHAARSVSWLLYYSCLLTAPFSSGSVHQFLSFILIHHSFPLIALCRPFESKQSSLVSVSHINTFQLQKAIGWNSNHASLKELSNDQIHSVFPCFLKLFFLLFSPLHHSHMPPHLYLYLKFPIPILCSNTLKIQSPVAFFFTLPTPFSQTSFFLAMFHLYNTKSQQLCGHEELPKGWGWGANGMVAHSPLGFLLAPSQSPHLKDWPLLLAQHQYLCPSQNP